MNKSRSVFILPLLATGGAVGCQGTMMDAPSAEQVESTSNAIIGGTVTSIRPEIGEVSSGGRGCTATLILPQYILTAAHCFNYSNSVPADSTFTFVDLTGTTQNYALSKIDVFGPRVTPPPGEKTLHADLLPVTMSSGIGNNDIAIARLANPVPSTQAIPATIADTLPPTGTTMTTFGYGCTVRTPESGWGTKRYYTFNWGTDIAVGCHGDSGGPVVIGGVNDGGAIVGVNSGDTDGTYVLVLGNVVWFKDQILDVIRRWEGSGYEYNVDRLGTDYRMASFSSPDGCRSYCSSDSKCRAFTWTPSSSTCVLKSGMPGWLPSTSGKISGINVTFGVSTDRYGSDFAVMDLPTPQPEVCASECGMNSSCLSYTYLQPGLQGPKARCYLKNGIPRPQTASGMTSGVNRGLEDGVDRPGADYAAGVVADVNACKTTCANDRRCKSFSYSKSTRNCWLKNAAPNPAVNGDIISGVRRGLEMNVNRGGSDLPGSPIALYTGAPEDCQARCEREPACKAFTYVANGIQGNQPQCWLKNDAPAPQSYESVVSGLKGLVFF